MNRHNRIDLLRQARGMIETDQFHYLCDAIRASKLAVPWAEKQQLLREIEDSLLPWHSVNMWLLKKVGVKPEDLTKEALIDYRLRWIDDMIEETIERGNSS